MAARTGSSRVTRFPLASVLCLWFAACSRTPPAQQAYTRAWSSYIAGNLAAAASEASAGVQRFERQKDSPSYWNLRFLEAEALTAQSNLKAAQALLRDPVPSRPGLDQVEVRRLIDLADAGTPTAAEKAATLAKARAMAHDPDLLIRITLTEGVLAYNEGNVA